MRLSLTILGFLACTLSDHVTPINTDRQLKQNQTFAAPNCQLNLEEFLKNKKQEKVTLNTACTVCHLKPSQCDCSKQPWLCDSIKEYNTKNWKVCDARYTRAILNFFFGSMGVIGNAVVVIVTIRFRQTSSRCHQLIGGLAGSDLVFSISQTIRYIPLFWTCQWRLSEQLCTKFPLIKDLSSFLSIGFILIIATERFSLIVCPHRKPLSKCVIALMCLTNLILGIGICIPKVWAMSFNPLTGRCHDVWLNHDLRLTYDYVLIVVYFVLPLMLVIYEHAQIARRLRHQQVTIDKANMADRNLRRNRRINRILVAIVIGYITLVFPKRIICLLKAYYESEISKSESLSTGLRLASCLPYGFHVALNPIIYSFFDRRFRKSVRSMVPCGFGGARNKNESAVTTSTISTNTNP